MRWSPLFSDEPLSSFRGGRSANSIARLLGKSALLFAARNVAHVPCAMCRVSDAGHG